jgi:hypothetical protein
MISSGQSCTTCHSKQEIDARYLIGQRLVERYITLYGATYDETFQKAQFYDAQYADAMIFYAQDRANPCNLIRHEYVDFEHVPREVQHVLGEADKPTAVVVRGGKVYATGMESRTEFDLHSTCEVNAVRAACLNYRSEGVFASWEVDGELYTTSPQIGPLLFAEAGWTKISVVRTVGMPYRLRDRQFNTLETPLLSNAGFLNVVASGYQDPYGYQNTAQPMWGRVLEANCDVLYNGAAVSRNVLEMRDRFTRFRFAATDICNICSPSAPIQFLKTLSDFMPAGVDSPR